MKGRNTTVVGVRLPDDVVKRLKALARRRRRTMSELLKPVIGDFAVRGYVPGETYVDYASFDEIEKGSSVDERVSQGGDGNVSPDVELERAKIVPSSSPEAPDILASPSKEKYSVIKGHHPCPCGSGKRYRDCCRPKLS
jgi:predicted transcriptional regulator